jgi:translation initiation factor IF-3
MTRQSLGRQILERLIKDVDQKGLVEFRPRQEGNTLHLILAPNKKEGGAKEKPHAPPKAAPPPASRGGAQTA